MTTSYFVAKADSFDALKLCVQTGKWACKDRSKPPHPKDILASACRKGRVILIFSVVNNHGWHGLANMDDIPDSTQVSQTEENPKQSLNQTKTCTENKHKESVEWHYFNVKWEAHYLDFGEQCLSSKQTEDLTCLENGNIVPVNKARNWQELDAETGSKICRLIVERYRELVAMKEEKARLEIEKQPKLFYDGISIESVSETWHRIVLKVETELGKVILACPFGSQRYNLQTPSSDTDMFLVYQANTKDVLGFHPPKQTLKSADGGMCDYTIHEIHRYCELLLQGDARCVETLFLHESSLVRASDPWNNLLQARNLFLNRDCLDKYLRDAQGSKGTKYLQKWCRDNPQATHLNSKMCKMLYVIVRLLQNARDIVRGDGLRVYREEGAADREQLMWIRAGRVTVQQAWDIIHGLEGEIEAGAETVPDTRQEVEAFLHSWLLDLRYTDFCTTMANTKSCTNDS